MWFFWSLEVMEIFFNMFDREAHETNYLMKTNLIVFKC